MNAQGSVAHPTDVDARRSSFRVPLARSLRLRISLLTTALIALVIATFLAAINRELVRTTRRSGGERALTMSAQIANSLAQGGTRGLTELRRLSTHPDLVAFLSAPTDANAATVRERLQSLATPGQPPIVVMNERGEEILRVAGPATGGAAA